MKIKLLPYGRLMSTLFAGFLVFSLLFFGGQAKALQLSDLNTLLNSAGKDYLSSVLNDYSKTSQGTYEDGIKTAQKVVNNLATQLQKAVDPNIKPAQRNSILKEINKSERTLRDLGTSFKGLAEDTATFDSKFESSVEELLRLVRSDVRDNLTQSEDSYKQISNLLSSLADNTKAIDENNLLSLAGKFGDNVKSLNQAFDLGNKALSAVSVFSRQLK